jgi:uncharacterized protein YbjQ (UPF0145 family)
MTVTTGLSGNEIYCLSLKNYTPGNIVIGNSVYSLGLFKSLASGVRVLMGGEVVQFTNLIKDGRDAAYQRLVNESQNISMGAKASGITGVTSEVIFHGSNMEFLSKGSSIHTSTKDINYFTTAADGQEFYAQLDADYHPVCFAFGNVAYSIGVGRGLLGSFKMLRRGEIKEYSDIFNHTRHLALDRIIAHAQENNANAVLGIRTTILPFGGVAEMLMVGTASTSKQIATSLPQQIVTSDMTNVEMWNMASLGYAPLKLLLGTSVYSLGVVDGITSALKSFVRGEINELTRLIYDARENAIAIINEEAKTIGADDVVGVKVYLYQLGNGLIEFLAIGTAVKKIADIKTQSEQLPPQAIVVDKSTFYDTTYNYFPVDVNAGNKPINRISILGQFIFLAIVIFWVLSIMKH